MLLPHVTEPPFPPTSPPPAPPLDGSHPPAPPPAPATTRRDDNVPSEVRISDAPPPEPGKHPELKTGRLALVYKPTPPPPLKPPLVA
ncbi:unannotated protein [freshwater metagenome]|uniref:Unannotated protein n=1 Tax=freshwater metagenome TaxID=449393 RepID=A0A6J7TZ68_9ZZZZ